MKFLSCLIPSSSIFLAVVIKWNLNWLVLNCNTYDTLNCSILWMKKFYFGFDLVIKYRIKNSIMNTITIFMSRLGRRGVTPLEICFIWDRAMLLHKDTMHRFDLKMQRRNLMPIRMIIRWYRKRIIRRIDIIIVSHYWNIICDFHHLDFWASIIFQKQFLWRQYSLAGFRTLIIIRIIFFSLSCEFRI